ncbi:RagB/SusD family nutrient uptake outer membrane protein [Pedobacter arcticus]|uniref:RagB/SusD family nutrient uptake outer membrane protein n=1 Tax=Pedobacter arcticus TaxID=752140 RepID=UPI00036E3F2F|nr:RagB/SusD family nutrient uptake outer membrane protein [Pedobacter arcticus]
MKSKNINNTFRIGQMWLYLLLASLTIASSSCTKDFEDYNTDPTGINGAQLLPDNNIGAFFPNLQVSIFNSTRQQYQIMQNLNADCYSGYMMSNNPFNPDVNNMNYFLTDRWNSRVFTRIYGDVMGGVSNLAKQGLKTSKPDFWAIALILKVEAMHRVTDKFGPIPYSKVGDFVLNTPYDSQKDVYGLFFKQLDTAVTTLQTFVAATPTAKPFQKFDLVYSGDYNRWIKLANSLRLRLAIHIAKVDPAMAKIEGEKALSNTGQLLSASGDIAQVAGTGAYQNPLYGIAISYNDIRMGAAAESYLVGYNDPRLPKYFLPATDPLMVGTYKGIRIGSKIPAKPGYNGFSGLNTTASFTASAPMIMMTPAEVYFLKAEAALRNWTGAGDAKTNYESGITTSFSQWGVSNAAYVNDAISLPTGYADPKSALNNSARVSTVTIKWDPLASNELMLEKIITQKWIAMFPEGQEAWTEFRRTGYPKLFTVVTNNSNGTINTDIQIRRLAYPSTEYSTNGKELQIGLNLLGGPDDGGTRVWWDVNKPNF